MPYWWMRDKTKSKFKVIRLYIKKNEEVTLDIGQLLYTSE